MFCPLCKAEYREGVGRCPDCEANLIGGSADAAVPPPQRAVWRTENREAAQRVRETLRVAGVPCYLKALRGHWLYAVVGQRPSFELWILKADAPQAHSALAQMEPALHFEDEPVVLPAPLMLRCPLCREEHPAEYERCPGCGVELAAWREPWPEGEHPENPPELVWRGSDPVTFSRAIAALREAAIPYRPAITSEHLAFGLSMPRPKLDLFVFRSQAAQARELLTGLGDSFPLTALPLSVDPPSAADSDSDTFLPVPAAEHSAAELATSPAEESRRSYLSLGAGCVMSSYFILIATGYSIWLNAPAFSSPFREWAHKSATAAGAIFGLLGLGLLWKARPGRWDKVGSVARLFMALGMLQALSWISAILVWFLPRRP